MWGRAGVFELEAELGACCDAGLTRSLATLLARLRRERLRPSCTSVSFPVFASGVDAAELRYVFQEKIWTWESSNALEHGPWLFQEHTLQCVRLVHLVYTHSQTPTSNPKSSGPSRAARVDDVSQSSPREREREKSVLSASQKSACVFLARGFGVCRARNLCPRPSQTRESLCEAFALALAWSRRRRRG